MSITTLSSREFNQNPGRAEKAAESGPVFITDRGRPAHVILTIADYRRLVSWEVTLAEAVAQPDAPDFACTPPRAYGFYRPPDLS